MILGGGDDAEKPFKSLMRGRALRGSVIFRTLFWVVACPVSAQERVVVDEPRDVATDGQVAGGPSRRDLSIVLGLGHSVGGLGGQVEVSVADSRLALYGGIGYTAALDPGDAQGLGGAAGVRWYAARSRSGHHHLLGELAFSLVKIRGGTVEFTPEGRALLVEGGPFFGPAAQIGHRYTADGGFTTLGTIGVGYAVGDMREGDGRLNLVGSVGAGLSF
ncbi:MAG: hypothetical protein ACRELC_01905 [Gemmatimonadota bacterium]